MGNLSVENKIGYGAAIGLYVVASPIVGLVRTITAIAMIAYHYFRKDEILKALNSNKGESNRLMDFVDKLASKVTEVGVTKTEDKAMSLWQQELKRGLVEIFAPIIAPCMYSYHDFTQGPGKAASAVKNLSRLNDDKPPFERNIIGHHKIFALYQFERTFNY